MSKTVETTEQGTKQETKQERLEEAVRCCRRDEVLKLLKDGALEAWTGQERSGICLQLMSLRSMDVADYLAKQKEPFSAAMLELDLEIYQNKNFVRQVLKKHRKKFDLTDEAECEKLFEIACAADGEETVRFLIRQKKAVSRYVLLGDAPLALFEQCCAIAPETLGQDEWVELYFRACTSAEGPEKLRFLVEKKQDLSRKNLAGETVEDRMEKRIRENRYPKGRQGSIQRTQDGQVLKTMKKLREESGQPKRRKLKPKERIAANSVSLVAAAIIIGCAVYYVPLWVQESAQESEAADTSSTDGASDSSEEYDTDTSRVVADGDTVNIDYTGYVDDVAFDGGSTNGAGTSLTIGSGLYIDDFEEQLIGHNVGETVTVNVTFPEGYSEELGGKDARFEVTINGIY